MNSAPLPAEKAAAKSSGLDMEIRYHHSPKEVSRMTTAELRQHFLIEHLDVADTIQLTYSHYDRVIIGGACPVQHTLKLEAHPELRAEYFLERRELGIINVGGPGRVTADGVEYDLEKLDGLYLGKGTQEVLLRSKDAGAPAFFYLLSAPAHQRYDNKKCSKAEAMPATVGDGLTSNKRTIYKYIHAEGLQSSQLVMGLTILEPGSVWNTMPAHVHSRRMEAYFYFDVAPNQRVMHLMGEPHETRHLVVAANQAIISPPWSIHSGCGTASYGFIWGMAGENYNYTDMDPVAIEDLR
ncbi:5-dehydro-4-deoxy-D-glucuronate isomerase [Pseudocnuella soli]|nr:MULTISPECIES: 5-dehydro-4-deoxy-D-glucuronate isomerase [Chitinophagaceae]